MIDYDQYYVIYIVQKEHINIVHIMEEDRRDFFLFNRPNAFVHKIRLSNPCHIIQECHSNRQKNILNIGLYVFELRIFVVCETSLIRTILLISKKLYFAL